MNPTMIDINHYLELRSLEILERTMSKALVL